MKGFVILAGLLALSACNQTSSQRELFTGSLQGEPQSPTPLFPMAGVPGEAVNACRDSIAAAASSLGAVEVEVASAGEASGLLNGMTSTPIEARIVYEQAGDVQVREALITCQLDDQGRVVALL